MQKARHGSSESACEGLSTGQAFPSACRHQGEAGCSPPDSCLTSTSCAGSREGTESLNVGHGREEAVGGPLRLQSQSLCVKTRNTSTSNLRGNKADPGNCDSMCSSLLLLVVMNPKEKHEWIISNSSVKFRNAAKDQDVTRSVG